MLLRRRLQCKLLAHLTQIPDQMPVAALARLEPAAPAAELLVERREPDHFDKQARVCRMPKNVANAALRDGPLVFENDLLHVRHAP